MRRIDLRLVLHRSLPAVYEDLVTRPTGKAVRGEIEQELAGAEGEAAVIDFSTVRCLDISCADEIVGKLLLTHGDARTIVLHGLSEAHRHAIEQVLERHGLIVVAGDRAGRRQLLGPVDEAVRLVFAELSAGGPGGTQELADRLSLPTTTAQRAVDALLALQVVRESSEGYVAVAGP